MINHVKNLAIGTFAATFFILMLSAAETLSLLPPIILALILVPTLWLAGDSIREIWKAYHEGP